MKKNNGHDGHKSHGILMLLCCLVPIGLLVMLSSYNFQIPGLKNALGVLLLLACPLGHILMMKFMSGGHNHDKGVEEKNEPSQPTLRQEVKRTV